MKTSYFKALGLGFALAATFGGANIQASTEEIRGDNIEEFVGNQVEQYFSLKLHTQTTAKKIKEVKQQVVDQFDQHCSSCAFHIVEKNKYRYYLALICKTGAVKTALKKGIKNLIEAEACQYASNISDCSADTATRIGQEIGKEALSLLNSNQSVDNFIGARLKKKVTHYYNNIKRSSRQKMERTIKVKAKEYAQHYFSGNEDSSVSGNINAIVNKAVENITKSNPNGSDIRNALLNAMIDHIGHTAYGKAKSLLRYTERRAKQVEAEIRKQLRNRINGNYVRDKALSSDTKGLFKDYLGEKLIKEIKTL